MGREVWRVSGGHGTGGRVLAGLLQGPADLACAQDLVNTSGREFPLRLQEPPFVSAVDHTEGRSHRFPPHEDSRRGTRRGTRDEAGACVPRAG